MNDWPKTFLIAVEAHDGWMIIEADEKEWGRLSSSLAQTRHVIGTNVLHVKRQRWLSTEHLDHEVGQWAADNLDVAF